MLDCARPTLPTLCYQVRILPRNVQAKSQALIWAGRFFPPPPHLRYTPQKGERCQEGWGALRYGFRTAVGLDTGLRKRGVVVLGDCSWQSEMIYCRNLIAIGFTLTSSGIKSLPELPVVL